MYYIFIVRFKLINLISVKELRDKKWKNIKDNYKKSISEEKNVRSGSAAQKKKPYAFIAALSFLQNSSNKRKYVLI